MRADLALVLEVALVGDDDDGEDVSVLDTQDLLMEGGAARHQCEISGSWRADAHFLERVAARDAVDQQEALAGAHVLLAHRAVFAVSAALRITR
jgi:hypothetical protein